LCYFIYLATPLTLSEVRSMLPPGMSAHSASPAEHAVLRPLRRGAQTVVQLRVGSCSCDLIRARDPDARTDERHLRARHAKAGLPRTEIIHQLERHRRGHGVHAPEEGWPAALAAFVSEHARNAGPTLYYLHFAPGPVHPTEPVRSLPVSLILARADQWLVEGQPTTVVP
jgi:hypothetical protein